MRVTLVRPPWRPFFAVLVAAISACSADQAPTGPVPGPGTDPDLTRAAFQLTIDVQTGQISVGGPGGGVQSAASRGDGPSFSILGTDAVGIEASNCTFSAIPGNTKQKRCTFHLSIANRLSTTDLVTASTFPQPPAGTNGILVFPFSSASLGLTGGTATPSPDWDLAPANFFNDFAGCATGKTVDCYRSELYPAPLYAGQTTAPRQVGFDVDKSAQSVAAFVLVAADLRDNPLRTVTLTADADNCGTVGVNSWYTAAPGDLFVRNSFISVLGLVMTDGLCSFPLSGLPENATIRSATLRAFQDSVQNMYGPPTALVEGDHVLFSTLVESGFGTMVTLSNSDFAFSTDNGLGDKALDVTSAVINDRANDRAASQFRFRLSGAAPQAGADALVVFAGPADPNPPRLVVEYQIQ
jgi:hypothetical protein